MAAEDESIPGKRRTAVCTYPAGALSQAYVQWAVAQRLAPGSQRTAAGQRGSLVCCGTCCDQVRVLASLPLRTERPTSRLFQHCRRHSCRGTAGSLEQAQLLRKAGLYLGLLSLDGEAAAIDVAASVRWLRLAACAGESQVPCCLHCRSRHCMGELLIRKAVLTAVCTLC